MPAFCGIWIRPRGLLLARLDRTVRSTRCPRSARGCPLALDRLTTGLVAICGALALVLAIVGVYAVMADVVARRTREIGVRVALGARPVQVVTLVYAQGLGLTAAGLATGLIGAFAGIKLLESITEGAAAIDVMTIAAIPAVLALMIVVAAIVPTARALESIRRSRCASRER